MQAKSKVLMLLSLANITIEQGRHHTATAAATDLLADREADSQSKAV